MQSADERRRARELEEARKAGTVPAEKDDEGNESACFRHCADRALA